MRIMVTSGPTRAWIDRIRYIANTSSGALGARIVEACAARGLSVLHLRGEGSEQSEPSEPALVHTTVIETVDDLIAAVHDAADAGDIGVVVHAMAVLDYAPTERLTEKKPSGDELWSLNLARTPKVTEIIRESMPDVPVIGFKLEAGVDEPELIRRAGLSRDHYGLAAVVANDLDRVGPDRHEALLLGRDNEVLARCMTKREIAAAVADTVVTLVDDR